MRENIMGKNMFAGGEKFWPEEAPFHTPVFVLTHEVRKPWERPGGTTFYFVTGLIGEFTIHYSPVFFGGGLPLFAGISKDIKVRIKKAVASRDFA
jgi:dihydrofolate reductase